MQRVPTVTIILPIRNEGSFVERSLGAVLEQDYPDEAVEIIVADGMSTDNTRDAVRAVAGTRPNVRIIDNPGKIVPTAMNAAIAAARGDVIVRVDGHTIIARDYVRSCVEALERSHADNVGGRMTAVATGAVGAVIAAATSSPFGVGGARFHYSDREEWVDTVYMGAWTRAVFGRIGLFDEEQVRNQDDEFNYRLREHGGRIRLCPEIASRYYNRSTFRSLWRQYFQYGFWKVRVLQKHPRQMRPRQFVPPAFVLALVVLTLAAALSPVAAWLLAGVVAAYALASIAASTLAWKDAGGGRARALLPLAFAVMHLSYGSGFLVGLARFSSRWGDREIRTSYRFVP